MANVKPLQTGRLRQELQRHRDSTDIYVEINGVKTPVASYEFTHRTPYIGPGIRDLVLRPHVEPVEVAPVVEEPQEPEHVEEEAEETEVLTGRKRGRPAKKED